MADKLKLTGNKPFEVFFPTMSFFYELLPKGDENMGFVDLNKEEVSGKGKITKVELKKFEEAFSNPEKVLAKARNPEQAKQRIYAVFTVKTEDDSEFTEVHGIPKGSTYDKKKNEWVAKDKLAVMRSLKNANNWFTKYNLKYKKDPLVGSEVELTMTPQGFLRIAVIG